MKPISSLAALAHRNRKRFICVAVLVCIYCFVIAVDWFLDSYVLDSPMFARGATKITRRHFQQPRESALGLENFDRFLDKVIRHKPGILAYKPFYVALLATYVALCVWAFLELTRNDDGS